MKNFRWLLVLLTGVVLFAGCIGDFTEFVPASGSWDFEKSLDSINDIKLLVESDGVGNLTVEVLTPGQEFKSCTISLRDGDTVLQEVSLGSFTDSTSCTLAYSDEECTICVSLEDDENGGTSTFSVALYPRENQ